MKSEQYYQELLQSMVGKTISSIEVSSNYDDMPCRIEISFTNSDKLEISSRGFSDSSSMLNIDLS
jgi:hypothetical protein